jgi:hypothetical protein
MTLLMMLSSTIDRKNSNSKNDKNVLLNPIGWLNNQHLVAAMHMLYIQKLQSLDYQQHICNNKNHTQIFKQLFTTPIHKQ